MRALSFLLIGVLAFLAMHAVLGTPHGHSYIHNLPWYDSFRNAFWQGDLYPRFLPDLWYGFGGYDFYFYAPLPFWLIALLGEVSCPGCSTNQVFAVGGGWLVLLSGVSFFVAARHFFQARIAAAGSLVYMFLPYHYAFDWYVRQAVGELAAYIFLPLLLLAAHTLLTQRKGGRLFALAFAGLVLSHLPSALIAIHVLALYVLCATWKAEVTLADKAKQLGRVAVWGGFGLCLSSLYWVPALAHLDEVSPARLYNAYADPVNWLLLDGRAEPDPTAMQVVKSVVLSVLTLVLTSWYLLRPQADKQKDSLLLWILVPGLFSLFLVSVLALPIWQYWILKTVQFPWRTLIFADLSLALASMVLLRHLIGQDLRPRSALTVGLSTASLLILCASQVLATGQAIPRSVQNLERAGQFEPLGAIEYFHPAFIGEILTTVRGQDLSGLTNDQIKEKIFAEIKRTYAEVTQTLETQTTHAAVIPSSHGKLTLQLHLDQAKTLTLPLTGWAHWQVSDPTGASHQLNIDPERGLLSISLSEGVHNLVLSPQTTPPQVFGSTLSLFAWLLLLGTYLYGRRAHFRFGSRHTGATLHV